MSQNKHSNINKRTKAEITELLDQLAQLLLWQEPGAAGRCFEAIIKEQKPKTVN